jgi:enoyl-CoA hydratase/carnithine racemase
MDTVHLAVADGVATISLNRPDRHNAIDDETYEKLQEVWWRVQGDDGARVLVLRGEGPSFCSGRDTAQLGHRPPGESDLSFVRRHQRFRSAQLESPKPVIAALRGHVLGGGLEMALSADLRIAASDVRMGFPEIHYGLMTDTGGSPLTTMLAGPSRAKWLLMTGRPIGPDQAVDWGLVDEVVVPEELDGRAAALAAELADKPTAALAMIKQAVDGMWQGRLHAALNAELLSQVALFAGDDYKARRPAGESQ